MNEAIVPVIKYSFGAIGLKTLEAFIHKQNNRSISMLERNGFKPGLNRVDEKNTNNIIYCLNSATIGM